MERWIILVFFLILILSQKHWRILLDYFLWVCKKPTRWTFLKLTWFVINQIDLLWACLNIFWADSCAFLWYGTFIHINGLLLDMTWSDFFWIFELVWFLIFRTEIEPWFLLLKGHQVLILGWIDISDLYFFPGHIIRIVINATSCLFHRLLLDGLFNIDKLVVE